MQLISDCQTYRTVNAGTRVPTTIGLIRIVDANSKHVFFIELHVRRQVVLEADETIRSPTERMPVNPHLAVVVHAVEIDKDLLAVVVRSDSKMFAIPADTAGKETVVYSAGMPSVFRALNTPVMWNMDVLPT